MPQKSDRRVQRTQRALRDALIALCEAHDYDTITIQAITDEANIGRATFYLHFRDKDDLLLHTLQQTLNDLVKRLDAQTPNLVHNGEPSLILTVFRHAAAHHELYRIILHERGAASVEQQLRTFAADITGAQMRVLLGPHEAALPVDLVANYFANSLIGMLAWWLENDMPYSADYMTDAMYQLGLGGMMAALGIETPPVAFGM